CARIPSYSIDYW
nr:immunoglobulin heavy chain junction region [Macaca mulatta]